MTIGVIATHSPSMSSSPSAVVEPEIESATSPIAELEPEPDPVDEAPDEMAACPPEEEAAAE